MARLAKPSGYLDQDLLLLAHDQLPLGKRLLTSIRVMGDRDLRERMAALSSVSGALLEDATGRAPTYYNHAVSAAVRRGRMLVLGIAAAFAVTGAGILLPQAPQPVNDSLAFQIEPRSYYNGLTGAKPVPTAHPAASPTAGHKAAPPVDAVTGPYETDCK